MSTDLHELSGAYALHALSDDERIAFERHLSSCEACADEVIGLREAVARLAVEASEPVPADLRTRVLREARTTPQLGVIGQGPGTRQKGSKRERMLAAVAAVLAVAVVGLAVQAGRAARQVEQLQQAGAGSEVLAAIVTASDARIVRLQGGPDQASGRLVYSRARDQALVLGDGMPPPPAGRTYQLWLIEGQQARPAGLFRPDEHGRVRQPLEGELANADALGVTVEPRGGSEQPTSDVLMSGELA